MGREIRLAVGSKTREGVGIRKIGMGDWRAQRVDQMADVAAFAYPRHDLISMAHIRLGM